MERCRAYQQAPVRPFSVLKDRARHVRELEQTFSMIAELSALPVWTRHCAWKLQERHQSLLDDQLDERIYFHHGDDMSPPLDVGEFLKPAKGPAAARVQIFRDLTGAAIESPDDG